MNDQKDSDRADDADRMPALLSVFDPVWDYGVERIVPDLSRQIEIDPVFGDIDPRLFRIPLKQHSG